jgi:hypothetical protein
MTTEVFRLGVNLAADVAEDFKASCRIKRVSMTEGVRRALVLWTLVENEITAGRTIRVHDPETDTDRELVFV